MDVEVRHLRQVIAVADELSFTRAAARLHLDQPSLSRQVAALERRLGVRLFERTTRSVRLTATGEAFVRDARQVVADLQRLVETARRSAGRDGTAGPPLRLGYLVPLRDGLMPRLVRALEAACGRAVDLVQHDYTRPDAGLADATTDLAVVNLPLSVTGLAHEPLVEEPRVVVVASEHPWAARGEVRLADLEGEPDLLWAVPPPGDEAWRTYWSAGDVRGGRLPTRRCEPRNPDEYAQLVATGRAFGLNLPAAAEPFRSYGVSAVPVVDLAPVTISVAWRHEAPPPAVDAVRRAVRELTGAG